MAKKEATVLEVHLANNWFDGASLRRKVDNPHFVPENKLDILPSSAKVMQDGELVEVGKLRNIEEDGALADKEAKAGKVTVPATVKKSDLTL